LIILGQLCLLSALIAAGYAAFACIAGARLNHPPVLRSGFWAAVLHLVATTAAIGILAAALVGNDRSFLYVAQYGSALLPWYFSLSALWVGQAGSLLLWAWLLSVVAVVFRLTAPPGLLRDTALGVLCGYLAFLGGLLIFAADPMQASLGDPRAGGLSPILQHTQMLFHPPLVFLSYALWGVPFALAWATLCGAPADERWLRLARPWVLVAWALLGVGILLGAVWAYDELGWGGYWSWDPVENGSLLPWLAGTALVHTLLAWRRRGVLKKTTLVLASAVFALCNFATFLTRSGLFSSLHEFSQSPIGWVFLGAMAVMVAGMVWMLLAQRFKLRPQHPLHSLVSREALMLLGSVALLLLAGATLVGTLSIPLSQIAMGARIVVGQSFYNHVLLPTGLVTLAAMAAAPLLRWGAAPTPRQRMLLLVAAGGSAMLAAAVAVGLGIPQPTAWAVIAVSAFAVIVLAMKVVLDLRSVRGDSLIGKFLAAIVARRRPYAAFAIHLGAICLAVGITGSALGTRKHEVALQAGDETAWAGRAIRFLAFRETDLADRRVAEAELEITPEGGSPYRLRPAQELFRGDMQWRVKVAIHSTWSSDFYVALYRSEGARQATFTFFVNPLMRWIWASGWIVVLGTLVAVWPQRAGAAGHATPPAPKNQALHRSATALSSVREARR